MQVPTTIASECPLVYTDIKAAKAKTNIKITDVAMPLSISTKESRKMGTSRTLAVIHTARNFARIAILALEKRLISGPALFLTSSFFCKNR